MRFVLPLLLLTLTGCNQTMQDFVRSAVRRGPSSAPSLPKAVEFNGMKFSGGSSTIKGTDMGMTITVSPTHSAMKGSNFGMRVGISRGPSAAH